MTIHLEQSSAMDYKVLNDFFPSSKIKNFFPSKLESNHSLTAMTWQLLRQVYSYSDFSKLNQFLSLFIVKHCSLFCPAISICVGAKKNNFLFFNNILHWMNSIICRYHMSAFIIVSNVYSNPNFFTQQTLQILDDKNLILPCFILQLK